MTKKKGRPFEDWKDSKVYGRIISAVYLGLNTAKKISKAGNDVLSIGTFNVCIGKKTQASNKESFQSSGILVRQRTNTITKLQRYDLNTDIFQQFLSQYIETILNKIIEAESLKKLIKEGENQDYITQYVDKFERLISIAGYQQSKASQLSSILHDAGKKNIYDSVKLLQKENDDKLKELHLLKEEFPKFIKSIDIDIFLCYVMPKFVKICQSILIFDYNLSFNQMLEDLLKKLYFSDIEQDKIDVFNDCRWIKKAEKEGDQKKLKILIDAGIDRFMGLLKQYMDMKLVYNMV